MPVEPPPKLSPNRPLTPEPATAPTGKAPPPQRGPAEPPRAMEKPTTLNQPEAAPTHPARQAGEARQPALEEEVSDLRQSLRRPGKNRRALAEQALALASSFRLRRSRRGRKLALELCEDAGAMDDELRGLAERLARLLAAEGDLHELTPDGTLRACRTLVELCDEEAP